MVHAGVSTAPGQVLRTCVMELRFGVIDPSAAVPIDPLVTSPGSLVRDATFGYVRGYLLGGQGVPTTGEFHSEATLDEIHSDD